MKDRTVSELKREASNIKREIDELDRAAHGMTFDELIRIMGGKSELDETAEEGGGIN